VRYLRATTSGTSTLTWDSGKTTEIVVPRVSARQTLDAWKLSVEDWHRGADGQREITRHQLTLEKLKPWADIPKLQDVSGIGTYTTTGCGPRVPCRIDRV
ncbi:hypothetical protein AB4212_60880, partial [Streptomyces sp. 2MCAF27]